MRIFMYAVLLVIIVAGCEKESKIKLPYDGDKIVVNSLIQPDSLIYIRVTQSKPVRESGNLRFPELGNAIVTLSEDDVVLPAPKWVLINGRGYFVSENIAAVGKRYTVHVAAEGLDDVSATDTTPLQPLIKNVQTQQAVNRIRFTLSDNIAETNYYRIRFFKADTVNGVLVKNKKDTVRCRLDPAFGDNFTDIISDSYYSEVLLSDARINGRDFEFVMQTENEMTRSSEMLLEVSALSESAYKYLRASSGERQDDDGNFLVDPVNIYSNIQNGYGIVAGVNATILGFKVE